MRAEGLVIAAGTVAFFGSMKEAGGIPDNTPRIAVGTIILAIGAAFVGSGELSGPVKALAWLMLLAAIVRYVPKFSKKG